MQAVILAAGEGKRIRPLTRSRPKALIPVANRPIIDYSIDALRACQISDIIVVVGYRKEQFIRHLNAADLPVEVVVQEKQLGTAHALRTASELIDDRFLVIPGDNYIDARSLGKIAAAEPPALLVKEHPYPSNFGVVLAKGRHLEGIVEKPEKSPSFMVSTGIFSLEPDMFPGMRETELTDAVNRMIQEGARFEVIPAGDWQDAVYPWDLLSMNRKLMEDILPRKAGTIESFTHIKGKVTLGKDSIIGPHCSVQGPVVIGEDCVIGPNTCIGPHTSIGAGTRVEPHCIIEQSLVMGDVTIGSFSHISSSIIGEGVRFGDHASTLPASNLIEIEGVPIRGIFGAIMGDGSKTGAFCRFEGAMVGNSAVIGSGKTIRGTLALQDDVVVI